MPSEYYFGYYFYAPQGRFEPCGMFTTSHIIATLICFSLVAILLFAFKKRRNEFTKLKLIRFSAVLLTVLEIIKITHSFIYGDYYLDAWFPLSYCGIFIFALWMAGYGKNKIKRVGEAFIAFGCPFAGIAFLIFPTTSLMIFPVWHYFSLYSLFFHSLMMYVGFTLLFDEKRLDLKTYLSYAVFVIIFAVPAIILNSIFDSNLMNLREPFNVPIQFFQVLGEAYPFLYTLIVIAIFMAIPIIMAAITGKLKKN